MRNFKLEKEISYEEIEDKIRDIFGTYTKTEDSKYVVTNPNSPIIESISVNVHESYIGLDIEEKSVRTVMENDNLDEVEDAVKKKNAFLLGVTGNTVQDRKEKMRSEVTDEDVVRENPKLSKY